MPGSVQQRSAAILGSSMRHAYSAGLITDVDARRLACSGWRISRRDSGNRRGTEIELSKPRVVRLHNLGREEGRLVLGLLGQEDVWRGAGEEHVSTRVLLRGQPRRIAVAIDPFPFFILDDDIGQALARGIGGSELR